VNGHDKGDPQGASEGGFETRDQRVEHINVLWTGPTLIFSQNGNYRHEGQQPVRCTYVRDDRPDLMGEKCTNRCHGGVDEGLAVQRIVIGDRGRKCAREPQLRGPWRLA
jgi:hypothetical protein